MNGNISLLNSMIERYNHLSYTHNYIFGFAYKGNVYMVKTTNSVLASILTLDKASRGAGYALRFCPTAPIKLFLMVGAELLCSVKYFNETCENSTYNKGEIFEKMVTEKFGLVWEKDNVPFTKAGDIEVNGIAYQIKYEKATFCNEKSLANLERA